VPGDLVLEVFFAFDEAGCLAPLPGLLLAVDEGVGALADDFADPAPALEEVLFDVRDEVFFVAFLAFFDAVPSALDTAFVGFLWVAFLRPVGFLAAVMGAGD
jgi:hypothetical protein